MKAKKVLENLRELNEAPIPSRDRQEFKKNFKALEDSVKTINNILPMIQKNFDNIFGVNKTDNGFGKKYIEEVKEFLDDLLTNVEMTANDDESSWRNEGMHYSTKLRQVEGSGGTRKAKMAIREAKRIVENLLDINHPSPSPMTKDDKQLLLDSQEDLSSAMSKVVEAKVGKRSKWHESNKLSWGDVVNKYTKEIDKFCDVDVYSLLVMATMNDGMGGISNLYWNYIKSLATGKLPDDVEDELEGYSEKFHNELVSELKGKPDKVKKLEASLRKFSNEIDDIDKSTYDW